jgi:hypothetical protein
LFENFIEDYLKELVVLGKPTEAPYCNGHNAADFSKLQKAGFNRLF